MFGHGIMQKVLLTKWRLGQVDYVMSILPNEPA